VNPEAVGRVVFPIGSRRISGGARRILGVYDGGGRAARARGSAGTVAAAAKPFTGADTARVIRQPSTCARGREALAPVES
jgi:hypothetical protein